MTYLLFEDGASEGDLLLERRLFLLVLRVHLHARLALERHEQLELLRQTIA